MRLSKHAKEMIGVGIATGATGLLIGLSMTNGNAQVVTACEPSPSPSEPASPSPTAGACQDQLQKSPDWPSVCNTGVPTNVVMTVFTGNMTINTANTVVDGKDIRGCVVVYATGVIIKNSRITCTNSYVVDVQTFGKTDQPRVTIQDSEISCGDGPGTGIGEINVNAYRLNIHGCENGFDIDSDSNIVDSYIHGLWNGPESHTDGIQTQVGKNLLVSHNTIYAVDNQGGLGTSAFIEPSSGVSKITLENNLVAGGAYTIYCHNAGTTFTLKDNHFSTIFSPKVGAFGPMTECTHTTNSGNIYHDGPNANQAVPIA